MDKLTAIKIKYDDGTYSDEIPVSVLSENVEWDNTHTLVDVLGSIDVDVTGTIQDQISQLFNEKVSTSALVNYVASQLNTDVVTWLQNNVNPVGSAVVVDKSLTIEGAAADAKETGNIIKQFDNIIEEKKSLNVLNFNDENFIIGKYINPSNGDIINNSAYNTSGFIPVEQNQAYTYTYGNPVGTGRNMRFVAAFDSNKNLISAAGTENVSKYTVPNQVAFIRISC